jgi:uncharacterized protein (TIGR03086 family)
MSENLRNFTKAIYGMDAVVRRCPPDAWDNDSPCEGWTARDVVGHQVGVLLGVANMARGNDMKFPETPEDLSDPASLWASARDEVLETLDQPGALQHSGPYWFGEMSIDQLIAVVSWDPLTHAWDLAQAAGTESALDAGLAQRSFDTISAIRPNLAKMGLITDEVPVPADADIVDRYLGLVGRNPSG